MRGSKPAGFGGVGERAARSLGSRRGARRAAVLYSRPQVASPGEHPRQRRAGSLGPRGAWAAPSGPLGYRVVHFFCQIGQIAELAGHA